MSRGKYQRKRKPFPLVAVMLIALLVLGISSGGTVAYLSKAADKEVTNTFETAPAPTVTVNEDNSVSIGDHGYAVYVRAVVVPNWKYGDQVVAAAPGEFTITAGTDWVLHNGFYYYTKPIAKGTTTPICSVTAGNTDNLVVDIAVQVIQALGTTDADSTKTAVLDAWGIQPDKTNP